MKIETIEQPQTELIEFLDNKIAEFNWARWEVSERLPLAVQLKNDQGEIIAGASGRTFGNWLQLSTLWVDESLRGQQVGSAILAQMEQAAKQRTCRYCLLDTLNFQAMPFYQKHGYEIQWTQREYPRSGCKYFMSKVL
ncbi:MAG: GNAT superfamily N-acetyltransferase [Paraglaciecola sp.]|jgi:GNAT superfamily N-acetyltransferase